MSEITERDLHEGWALISYDIADNNQRDHFRDKLKEFGGTFRTQSVYLIPLSVRSFDEIERFAQRLGVWDKVDIIHYGARNITQLRTRTQEYRKDLMERMETMTERVHKFKEDLFSAEEKLFDESKWDENKDGEKVPPRFSGWANKMQGIRDDQKKLAEIVDKYAGGKLKTKYEAYWSLFLKLCKRYERMMEQKHEQEGRK